MTDPVTALLLGTLVFGLGAVVGLMSRRADTYAPAPGFHEPPRHVAPVRVGTCFLCGAEGPVEAARPHVLFDHVDVCKTCGSWPCPSCGGSTHGPDVGAACFPCEDAR